MESADVIVPSVYMLVCLFGVYSVICLFATILLQKASRHELYSIFTI